MKTSNVGQFTTFLPVPARLGHIFYLITKRLYTVCYLGMFFVSQYGSFVTWAIVFLLDQIYFVTFTAYRGKNHFYPLTVTVYYLGIDCRCTVHCMAVWLGSFFQYTFGAFTAGVYLNGEWGVGGGGGGGMSPKRDPDGSLSIFLLRC